YTINEFQKLADDKALVSITINSGHQIFEGHFPGQPVTPGVCMMQIIKELGEKWSNKKLMLKTAKNVKFMAIINPEKNPKVQVELLFEKNEQGLVIKSTASIDETIALKFSGIYKELNY